MQRAGLVHQACAFALINGVDTIALVAGTPCTGWACAPSVRIRAHQRRGHDCVGRDAMHGLGLCTKRAHSRSSTAWTRLRWQGRHARAGLVHQACAFALINGVDTIALAGTPCTGWACAPKRAHSRSSTAWTRLRWQGRHARAGLRAPSVRIRAHQRRGHDCVGRDAMHGLGLCTKRAHSRSSTAWTRLRWQGRHARAGLVHEACAFALINGVDTIALAGTPCTGWACAPSVRIRAHQRRGHDCVGRDAMHGLGLCIKRAHSRSSTAWTRLRWQGRHARAGLVHQACAFALINGVDTIALAGTPCTGWACAPSVRIRAHQRRGHDCVGRDAMHGLGLLHQACAFALINGVGFLLLTQNLFEINVNSNVV